MHHFSSGPLPFGELHLWQPSYREFACSRETAEWLMSGAMTSIDDVPVTLQITEQLVGGHNVMVKAWVNTAALEQHERLEEKVAA